MTLGSLIFARLLSRSSLRPPVRKAFSASAKTSLLQKGLEMELILVDDGSREGSLKEMLKIKQRRENTKVVKLKRNFGAVHASKTGLPFVTGVCFITLAADLQESPALVLTMVDKWLEGANWTHCWVFRSSLFV